MHLLIDESWSDNIGETLIFLTNTRINKYKVYLQYVVLYMKQK